MLIHQFIHVDYGWHFVIHIYINWFVEIDNGTFSSLNYHWQFLHTLSEWSTCCEMILFYFLDTYYSQAFPLPTPFSSTCYLCLACNVYLWVLQGIIPGIKLPLWCDPIAIPVNLRTFNWLVMSRTNNKIAMPRKIMNSICSIYHLWCDCTWFTHDTFPYDARLNN